VTKHAYSPYAWMLLGCVSFTIMGGLAHELGVWCEWQIVAIARSFLVLFIVGCLSLATGTKLVFWRPARLWVRSLAGSISLVGSFYALTRLPVSNVLTLTNTFPIWVALLSWPMLGVMPSFRVWIAILFAVTGVFFIQKPELPDQSFAFWVALASAISTAIAMLGLHRLHDIHPHAVVVHFSFVSMTFAVIALFVFPRGNEPDAFDRIQTWGLLIGVGLTASIGQLLLTKAFAAGEPSKVSVVGLTQVVFALLMDMVCWNHRLEWNTLVGIAMIVLPTAWVILERRK
jgi:drug/metabolite transporter (DMT)-like permease